MNFEEYYRAKIDKLPDAQDRIFERNNFPENPNKFHIIGICGTAMGSLAGLLSKKGYKVSGSDQVCFPPISTMLEHLDVDTSFGNFEEGNVGDAEVVVVGNVAKPHNPEARFARLNKIPQVTLPEALRNYVFKDAKRIICAGTHGKTTTTGLLAHIFYTAGKNPGYMIGGVPQQGEDSFALGSGEYALFEGDEYDTSYFDKAPKFLHYGAQSAIITSLELDHLDIYDDWTDYKQAFKFLIESMPKDGLLVISDEYLELENLAKKASCKVILYGSQNRVAKNIRQEGGYQVFDYTIDSKVIGTLKTPLSGKHNVSNIVAATTLALSEGIEFEDIQKAVLEFSGMKRRQEVKAEINGITIMDDFAHHPTAVKTTLDGIKKKFHGRRLVALFEPGTNTSRKKIFEKEYIESFDKADVIYIKLPPMKEGDNPADFIDGDYVASEITKHGPKAFSTDNVDDLLDNVVPMLQKDDVVVFMSNRSFDGGLQKLVDRLSEK